MDTTVDQLIRLELPAARDGDRDAYGRIVVACQNTITAIALAITRDVPSSEDIAQDAFLSAWQHLRRLQNADSFLPWLRQITRNLARDHLRAKVRGPFPVDRMSINGMEAAIAAAADPAPSPLHALIDEERHIAAADVISALPEDSRETLLLFYREGQSSKQVAALLGLSDAAVRKRLSRARNQVQEDLLARFAEFAKDSAPAAAFATIVTSALVVASPSAAAATMIGGAGLGAKTIGQVLLGAATGVGIGLAAASASIFWGWRKQMGEAMDAQERRELTRSAIVNSFAVFGYLVSMLLTTTSTRGWVPATVATCVFMSIVFWQTGVVQPRAKARRFAVEARIDPEGAARRRRRERFLCRMGLVLGTLGGFGGLIAGLVAAGRITF